MSTTDNNAPAFDAGNPGHWKLELLLSGLSIPADLAEEFEMATGVPVTQRLLLELPRDVLCLAYTHVESAGEPASPFRVQLVASDEGWRLRRGELETPVTVRPPIETEMWGRVIRIDDYVICDLSDREWGGRFRSHYGLRLEHTQSAPRTADPLLDAIESVARRRTLRGVHVIAYEDPSLPDARMPLVRLAPTFHAIHRNFACALTFEGYPPDGVAAIETAYAGGADQLAFHFGGEPWRSEEEKEHLPARRYENALHAAREVFESGALKSALFFSASGADVDTANEAKKLLQSGVVPLLWAGKPWPARDAGEQGWQAAAALLREVAIGFEGAKVNLARVKDRALQIPPSELRFFHPTQKAIVAGLQGAANTGWGRAAQRNLSALRRHLRVRGSGIITGEDE